MQRVVALSVTEAELYAAVQCVQDMLFVWKINNFFYVAMYDHLYQHGYVRNVPGAPMCGCAEQMPIVSRADCTEMDITQTVRYSWVNQQLSVRALNVNVDFNACNNNNNDLESYYERLVDEGRADEEELEALQERLVGDCDDPLQVLLMAFSSEIIV